MSKRNDAIMSLMYSKKYIFDHIMDNLENTLIDRGLNYTTNSKKTEFVVKDVKDECELIDELQRCSELSHDEFTTVIQIIKNNEKLYIRQKIK